MSGMNDGDMISRQAAYDALMAEPLKWDDSSVWESARCHQWMMDMDAIKALPPAQPTIYGYNIEHLELIARVLQKENLPPERVVEALTDIGRIIAIVRDEFEESLRKAVEQCKI